MDRHYKKWTKRDEEMLMELYKNRIKQKEIARALERTPGAIMSKLNEIREKQNNRILIDSGVPAIAVTETDDNIAKIKKYIENIITPTYINDALTAKNARLKAKNQKLESALIKAKNVIDEALKQI